MMRSPFVQLTNLNGPVPTGLRANSSLCLRTAVGLTIKANCIAKLAMNGASMRVSSNLTVKSSTLEMDLIRVFIPMSFQYSQLFENPKASC